MQKKEYLIAFGSNLETSFGTPSQSIAEAIRQLAFDTTQLRRVSRFFQTPCFPPGAGPDYVNAAAAIASQLEPAALMVHLHGIEAEFARSRETRWGSRTLDLDLLAAGDTVLPDRETYDTWRELPPDAQRADAPQTLILPHPRLQDRGFVLVPLCDIAPGWVHPVLGQTARALCDALPAAERAEIRPL